ALELAQIDPTNDRDAVSQNSFVAHVRPRKFEYRTAISASELHAANSSDDDASHDRAATSDRHQGPSGFGRERGVVPQLRGGERRRRRPPLRQETARRDPRRREELPRLPGGGHFAQHGRGVHAASDAVEPATGVVPPSSAAFKPAGSRHYT